MRSVRSGWRAFAHRRWTLPGVSSPCRVVRSIRVTARMSQAACHACLTVRRPARLLIRRSTALRLMRTCSTQSRSSGVPGLRMWLGDTEIVYFGWGKWVEGALPFGAKFFVRENLTPVPSPLAILLTDLSCQARYGTRNPGGEGRSSSTCACTNNTSPCASTSLRVF